jgi:hypothetical protein
MHSILKENGSICDSLFSSVGMVGSVYIMVSSMKCMMTCVSLNVGFLVYRCSPFFVWYGENNDCILVCLYNKSGPMYGFLYIFFVVWVGISII